MDLFDEANQTKGTDNVEPTTTPTQPTNQEPTQPSFLDELVGEDKKYKDVQALAKSRLDADNYIKSLETQISELNGELSQRLSSQEVLEEIKKQRSVQAESTSSKEHTTPVLDEASVADMVRNQMTVLESQKTAQANLNDAVEDLMSVTGSKEQAVKTIESRAKELNVTVDFLKDTAAKSPTAFKSLMGTGTKSATPANLQGSTSANSDALGLNNPNAAEGSKEYFDNIRKNDPSKYFTPKVQQAIMKAAAEGKYSL